MNKKPIESEQQRGSARALIKYRDATSSVSCPFGDVTRIMTGGEGGVANVHVVRVTRGSAHVHTGYNEVYYVLSGRGVATVESERYELRPGAVLNIPLGNRHAIEADDGKTLEIIIFGTPAMTVDDERFVPTSASD